MRRAQRTTSIRTGRDHIVLARATRAHRRRATRRSAPASDLEVDVVIVGGGFTGLWTAIALTDTDPSLRVVVLEAETVALRGQRPERRLLRGEPDPRPGQRHQALPRRAASASSTRASTTSRASSSSPASNGIDCDLEETGTLALGRPAAPGRRVQGVGRRGRRVRRGRSSSWTGRPPRTRSTPRSGTPACTGRPGATSWSTRPSCAGASPGSRASAASAIHEHTRVTGLRRRAGGVDVTTAAGATVRAAQVVVATSAYSGWLRRLSPTVRARLRLRPRVRAADARAARLASAGRGARACPTRTTSSTTSG